MTDAIEKRLTELRAKLKARDGKKPYRENVPAIKTEIARLETMLETHKQRAAEAAEKAPRVRKSKK